MEGTARESLAWLLTKPTAVSESSLLMCNEVRIVYCFIFLLQIAS
jgi:hypothetical protein